MRTSHYTLLTNIKVKYKNIRVLIFNLCLGGYREGETPGPIPNPEAKPLIADNTALCKCGNVGRCLVLGFKLKNYLFPTYFQLYLH